MTNIDNKFIMHQFWSTRPHKPCAHVLPVIYEQQIAKSNEINERILIPRFSEMY